MSHVFILGRAAVYVTTSDAFRGVLLSSKEVRAEVLAHVEVVMLKSASEATIAMVFACRQLMTLEILWCTSLTALPDQLSDCAALTTLNLPFCKCLTALRDRLGDCVALATLDLR